MNSTPTHDKVQLKRPQHPSVATNKAGHWYQHVNRYWMSALSGSELKIVLFVLNGQLGWNTTEAIRVSRSVFEKGVVGRDGTVWHEGTGLSKSTIDLALNTLEQRRVLRVVRKRVRNGVDCYYSINWFWNPPTEPEPKPENPARNSGRVVRKSNVPMPECRVQRESSGKIFSKGESHSALSAGSLDLDENGRKQIGQSRNAKHSILYEVNPSLQSIRAVWETAVFETFQDASPLTWSRREAEALHGYCKRWQQNHSEPFLAFLDWCVRHWRFVIDSAFRNLASAPALPMPFFLVRTEFGRRFEEQFALRRESAKRLSMTSREQRIANFVGKGFPYDVAAREVDETLQPAKRIMKERQKLQKEIERTQHFREVAKAETRRARELIRRLSPPPVQPKPIKVKPVEEIDFSSVPKSFGSYEQMQPVANSCRVRQRQTPFPPV